MAIPATQLRPGMVIKFNNDLFSIFKMEHRTPGNLRGFVQVKIDSQPRHYVFGLSGNLSPAHHPTRML